jgi:tRNA threonylcarbamoyladenosine modification (KEOPS) complex Cgi121 subunit
MKTQREIYKLANTFVTVIGSKPVLLDDIGTLIDNLRRISSKVSVQAIDANVVYGIEHLIEVLKITLEASRRGILVAKNPETDLLLRVTYTNQISLALKYGGLKNNANCCFVILAKDKKELSKVSCHIYRSFRVDDSVLRPNAQKRKKISRIIGITGGPALFDDDFDFTSFIIENASLIQR